MAQTPKKAMKRGLGRGFESLLSNDFDKSLVAPAGERVQQLALDIVKPNPQQPRRHFDDAALTELAASIKTHGVLLPIVVVTGSNNSYVIVAGERRWRASQLAGLQTVPAVVRSLKELEQLEIALTENVQRVDLSPLEQAASLAKLHDQFSTSYEAIAQRLGKAPSTVNNLVRLLQLSEPARQALHEQKISEGHARAILALKQLEHRTQLLELILSNGWTVRQAERYVASHKQGIAEPTAVTKRVATETTETKSLAEKIGHPVRLLRTARGGRIEISFKSDAELALILKHLG
jgi:ParB family chromosome partitioning protein